jgi:hypothetical protein
VALSTRLALESPLVTTDVINMAVLPYLAVRHRADDTPTTVVNGVKACVGVLAEEVFVERVLAAAGAGSAATCPSA